MIQDDNLKSRQIEAGEEFLIRILNESGNVFFKKRTSFLELKNARIEKFKKSVEGLIKLHSSSNYDYNRSDYLNILSEINKKVKELKTLFERNLEAYESSLKSVNQNKINEQFSDILDNYNFMDHHHPPAEFCEAFEKLNSKQKNAVYRKLRIENEKYRELHFRNLDKYKKEN